MQAVAFALILVATAPDGLPSAGSTAHDVEIAAFATTAAVVLTASAKCDDILVDHDLFDALKSAAHIDDDDKPALTKAVQADVAMFRQAIKEAPSLRTWCDTAYRLYGTPGTLVPGLLAR